MKSVIFLVLDSFSYRDWEKDGMKNTPFLAELRERALCADNLYSQGPYTEAAMRALMCGINTLDNEGNLLRYEKAPRMIFDYFLESNYKVHAITYPANMIPLRIKKNDNFYMYYARGLNFKDFWPNRFDYYADLLKNNKMGEKEWNNVEELFEYCLRHYMDFCKLKEQKVDIDLISKELINCDLKQNSVIAHAEWEKFNSNKRNYIEKYLLKPQDNALHKIKEIDVSPEYNIELLKYIRNKYKLLLTQLKLKQIFYNIMPPDLELLKLIKSMKEFVFHHENKNATAYFRHYVERMMVYKQFDIPYEKKNWYFASIRKQFQKVYTIIDNHLKEKEESPFFIYLQPEELHSINNWLSYDCSSKKLVDDEMKDIKTTIRSISNRNCGNIPYKLSMRYVDTCIQELFEKIKEKGIENQVDIVITSDHGSSFGNYPIRNADMVNNWFCENYHIPFMFLGRGEKCIDKKLHENVDILPTILDFEGITYGKELIGKSFYNGNYRKIVHSEYLGPGCPDLENKDIWYTARNDKYSIFYKVKKNEDFSKGTLCAVYKVDTDYYEKNNIIETVKRVNIQELLDELEHRHVMLNKESGEVK